MNAQARWSEIAGANRTWFCGAYWANGCHEDGVSSALRVVDSIANYQSGQQVNKSTAVQSTVQSHNQSNIELDKTIKKQAQA